MKVLVQESRSVGWEDNFFTMAGQSLVLDSGSRFWLLRYPYSVVRTGCFFFFLGRNLVGSSLAQTPDRLVASALVFIKIQLDLYKSCQLVNLSSTSTSNVHTADLLYLYLRTL
jgi:hypothetical protein